MNARFSFAIALLLPLLAAPVRGETVSQFLMLDQSLDEYNKKMDEIIKRDEEIKKRAEETASKLEQSAQEIDCRTIRLHDGRRAYVDGNQYRDEQGRVLQGQDRDEARRNEIDLSDPVS